VTRIPVHDVVEKKKEKKKKEKKQANTTRIEQKGTGNRHRNHRK